MNTRIGITVVLLLGGLFLYAKMQQLPEQLPKPDNTPGVRPSLVLFTKDSCPPCEQQKKCFQEPDVQKKLAEYSVSVSDDRSVAHSYSVRAYPTLVVIDPADPKLVLGQHEGYLDGPALIQWLDSLPSLETARKKRRPRRPRLQEAPLLSGKEII